MEITRDIRYIGVNDHEIDLFEGQYVVENGMTYNSYAIVDEKIAIMDTVEVRFGETWLANMEAALDGRTPDYLIVQHMEPDHSANIVNFVQKFPEAKVVASAMAFKMMNQFYGSDFADNRIVVADGDTLDLGNHKLTFVGAPMVHWPEVVMTYDATDKVLFSADGFGKFGSLDIDEDWACEARRYYFGIVGKYGPQVQNVLKKAANLEISAICPLHGPMLTENLGYYIDLYNTWSSYEAESEGVFIAYTSVYGHTKEAAQLLAASLEAKGCPRVSICDLAREDMAEAVEDAFRHDRLVLATTTYSGGIFPFMEHFIIALKERGFQKRRVGLIENGSWAPIAAKTMKSMLAECKDLKFTDTTVTILSALKDETKADIEKLADELCKPCQEAAEKAPCEEKAATKKYKCKICGYEYEGDELPEDFTCPLCKRPASDFEEVK